MNNNRPMATTMKTFPKFLLVAVLGLGLLTGCGGGGGGGSAVPNTTPQSGAVGETGQARFTVQFPPAQTSPRQGSVIPTDTVKVRVQVFEVEGGSINQLPKETAEIDRPSPAGGPASIQIILPIGRYLAKVQSLNAAGDVLAAGLEAVLIQARTISSVPATLGVVHNANGFTPNNLTLKQGDRLVVRQEDVLPGLFQLEGASCSSNLQRSGALACTLRTPGTYTLKSPEGHTATITVNADEAQLLKAKPSLGVLRSEGIAHEGSFTAQFTLHNGGEALPAGLQFDSGKGGSPVPFTESLLSQTYGEGGYLVRLLSATGEVLSQVFVGVFEPQVEPVQTPVTLATLPQSVTQSSLTVNGTGPAGSTVVVQTAGGSVRTTVTTQGIFSATLTLVPGSNQITAYGLNAEGLPGPTAQAQVAFIPQGDPTLASIQISGVPAQIVAGQPVSLTIQGLDQNNQPIQFTPTILLNGIEGTQTNPTTFVFYVTGTGTLTVSGPGSISQSQSLTVIPGAAAMIHLSPGNLTIKTGQSVQFSAVAKDTYGNVIPDAPVVLTAAGSLPTPDAGGLMTPSTSGFGVVRATIGQVKAEACVSVNPGLVTRLATSK